MSLLVRVALAIAEVLAGGMLGAMAGLWWARRSEPVELHDEAATIDTGASANRHWSRRISARRRRWGDRSTRI